jgi:hypothetical protein
MPDRMKLIAVRETMASCVRTQDYIDIAYNATERNA